MSYKDKNVILERMKRDFRWGYVLSALILVALGLVLLLYPTMAMNLLCYLVGAVLTVYGGFNIVTFLLAKERQVSFALVIGVITTAVGIFILCSPGSVFNAIQIILGLIIVVDSLMNIKRAITIRELEGKGWLVTLIASIVAIIFGILLMIQRDVFGKALFIVIGILLIYQGLSDLISLFRLNILGRTLFKKLDAAADTDDTLDT